MTRLKRSRVFALLGIMGGMVLSAGIKAAQIVAVIQAGKAFVSPPQAVTSIKVETAEWGASRAAVGTLVAVRGVMLSAEIIGWVKGMTFESGTFGKSGAVLVHVGASTELAQLDAE